MESPQTWVEALNISPEKLSDWSSQAPSSTPLLVWCLENSLISVENYLTWAAAHFGLAVLNTAFFHQSFDTQHVQNHRESGVWHAWCFPVGIWEDVTYVACAEPPSELPTGRFVCVLTDPAAMREVWGQTQTGIRTEEPKPPLPPLPDEVDAPVGINPNAKTFVLNLDGPPPLEVRETPSPAFAPPPPPVATKAPSPPAKPVPAAKATAPRAASVNEEHEIRAAIAGLKDHYQHVMVMRVSDGSAHPYKWDEELVVNAAAATVNLAFPSFFRIVAKTLQPYHGYVIDSPAHRDFFANLEFAHPPGCVTAVPLKSQTTLLGILVAFGAETAQAPEALAQATAVAEKLNLAIEPLWARAA